MSRKSEASLRGLPVLVTGATGFIGSHAAAELARRGARVSLLSGPEDRGSRPSIHRVSLLDFKKLRALVARLKPRKVVHCAAVVDLERSYAMARRCIAANIQGTVNLLESLRGLRVDRFVYLSSTEVYGDGPAPFKETMREDPPSPYAISKLAGEHFAWLYARGERIPVCVLRLATCYGPGQNPARVIPSAILACLRHRPLRISRGDQRRDFVFAEDAVDGILRALTRPAAAGRTLNLGSRRSHSIREAVRLIQSLTGSRSQVQFGALPTRDRENRRWSSSGVQAAKVLGWRARTGLREGLRRTIESYRLEERTGS